MPKASELKKGHVVEINGTLYVVQKIDVHSPSSRGAQTLYKVRFSQVPHGGKYEETFIGTDMIKQASLERRLVSYLYREDDLLTFMDQEDYSQYSLNEATITDEIDFISDGMTGILVLLVDGNPIGIELPNTVVMNVVECMPGMQSASATGRTKPAKCSNGYELQVPEYTKEGDKIKVNTETGKFISRA